MRLAVANLAPAFHTVDVHGAPVHLESFRGKRTLLAFHRFVTCPFCNFRIHELRAHGERLAGLNIVTVFESKSETITKADMASQFPFTFVADAGHELYRLYGVESSMLATVAALRHVGQLREAVRHGLPKVPFDGALSRLPADFLIGPDLRIEAAHYGASAADHLPIATIIAFLNAAPVIAPRAPDIFPGSPPVG